MIQTTVFQNVHAVHNTAENLPNSLAARKTGFRFSSGEILQLCKEFVKNKLLVFMKITRFYPKLFVKKQDLTALRSGNNCLLSKSTAGMYRKTTRRLFWQYILKRLTARYTNIRFS